MAPAKYARSMPQSALKHAPPRRAREIGRRISSSARAKAAGIDLRRAMSCNLARRPSHCRVRLVALQGTTGRRLANLADETGQYVTRTQFGKCRSTLAEKMPDALHP